MTVQMTVASFAEKVKVYCESTTGNVTSWGRTPKHNKAVGGLPNSFHLTWLAVDVVYDVCPPTKKRLALATSLGLQLVRESSHDHLEPL